MAIEIPQSVRVALVNEAGKVVEHVFEAGVLTKVEDEMKAAVAHLLRIGKAKEVADPAVPAEPVAEATPAPAPEAAPAAPAAPSDPAPAAPAKQGK